MKHDNLFDQFKVPLLQEKSFKMFNHAQMYFPTKFKKNGLAILGNILWKLLIKMASPENSYFNITPLHHYITLCNNSQGDLGKDL